MFWDFFLGRRSFTRIYKIGPRQILPVLGYTVLQELYDARVAEVDALRTELANATTSWGNAIKAYDQVVAELETLKAAAAKPAARTRKKAEKSKEI